VAGLLVIKPATAPIAEDIILKAESMVSVATLSAKAATNAITKRPVFEMPRIEDAIILAHGKLAEPCCVFVM
jgi:hypothetical protein